MAIRSTAKAIILRDGKMLVNKDQNTMGDRYGGLRDGDFYYDLPGGGQNQYETLEEAVVRECLEETGYTVAVDRLAAVCEEISVNEQFRVEWEKYAHRIHFVFLCHISDEPRKTPSEIDQDMVGSEWVKIGDVKNLPLYPTAIRCNIEKILRSESTLFLGSERVK